MRKAGQFFLIALAHGLAACGFVGVDPLDGAVPADGSVDSAMPDVPELDAAGPTGSCGVVSEAACPNLTVRLGPGEPDFAFTIPNFNGLANNVDGSCFADGGSDWTLLVEPTADGFVEPLVRASVGRVALATLAGGCGGELMNCNNPAPSFGRSQIRAGESFLLVVEAQGTCGASVDVTLTFVP